MPPDHVHARETDAPGKLTIPRWVFQLAGTVATIIGVTVLYMGWMDSRYASKNDIQEVKSQVQDVSTDVKEIRRVIDDQFSK